jgi:hypothetical protein
VFEMSLGRIIIEFEPMSDNSKFEGHLHEKDRQRAIQILQNSEMDFEGDYEDCKECQTLKNEALSF